MPSVLLSQIDEVLENSPVTFLQPKPDLHASTIQYVQQLLNPLARETSDASLQRELLERQERKRKRRSGFDGLPALKQRRIAQIHTEGFEVEQIWSQAKLVLEQATEIIERELPILSANAARGTKTATNGAAKNGTKSRVARADQTDSGDSEIASSASEDDMKGSMNANSFDSNDSEVELDDEGGLADEVDEGNDSDMETAGMPSMMNDETDASEVGEEDENDDSQTPASQNELVKDKHGLNDGFFSIDQFNKQTQFLEHQDARGDPDDGRASDEESIDWGAEPSMEPRVPSAKQSSKGKHMVTDDDDDEEGPAPFGNMDLNAPEGESDDEEMDDADADIDHDGLNGFGNTNDIRYEDFFAPPAREKSKRNKGRNSKDDTRASSKPQTRKMKINANKDDASDDDVEMKRAMADVHRDLFDDADEDDEDGFETDARPVDQSNLSNHEKRQLALRAEIEKLEKENVARKDWALAGESVAPARPVNSLLAEDLDFERAGKPVPIPTAEGDEDIEALIRRRILNKDFDEVMRRRPTDLATGSDPRRGRVRDELSDAKPAQGLAAEYEDDYLRKSDPNYVDKRSEETKAVHAKIEAQWKDISAQLDALSNWHYKPRPPTASLDVRTDAPVISIEDARPSTAGASGLSTSGLAPQEVFNVSEAHKNRKKSEILAKGSTAVVSREEEGRDAAKRRRKREKARQRNANIGAPRSQTSNSTIDPNNLSSTAAGQKGKSAKDELVGQLKKGGVRVIGKKGELNDVEGEASRHGTAISSKMGGSYKL